MVIEDREKVPEIFASGYFGFLEVESTQKRHTHQTSTNFKQYACYGSAYSSSACEHKNGRHETTSVKILRKNPKKKVVLRNMKV